MCGFTNDFAVYSRLLFLLKFVLLYPQHQAPQLSGHEENKQWILYSGSSLNPLATNLKFQFYLASIRSISLKLYQKLHTNVQPVLFVCLRQCTLITLIFTLQALSHLYQFYFVFIAISVNVIAISFYHFMNASARHQITFVTMFL